MSLGNWFLCEWASCATRIVSDHTDREDMQEAVADIALVATPVRGPRQGHQMTPAACGPTQLALVELESTP
jgi:hypothetical protein